MDSSVTEIISIKCSSIFEGENYEGNYSIGLQLPGELQSKLLSNWQEILCTWFDDGSFEEVKYY